jgi:hypothetical protein
MKSYNTLSEAVNDLEKRGFTYDFKLCNDALECPMLELKLHPNDFEIVEHYHFDGMTDPGDEAIVYAIQSLDGKTKGLLISGYGISSDALSTDMLKKLKDVSHHDHE